MISVSAGVRAAPSAAVPWWLAARDIGVPTFRPKAGDHPVEPLKGCSHRLFPPIEIATKAKGAPFAEIRLTISTTLGNGAGGSINLPLDPVGHVTLPFSWLRLALAPFLHELPHLLGRLGRAVPPISPGLAQAQAEAVALRLAMQRRNGPNKAQTPPDLWSLRLL